jgi:predicted short-subunit dehydrogenase-like oxidoreductase (DUF2520 family)
MKIFVFGAGKVGRALAHAWKQEGESVTLWPARRGVPVQPIDAAVIVLSVRDKQLGAVAADFAQSGIVKRNAVVVHNAGALPAEALAALRGVCAGVAQMHPMISFGSKTFFPTLERGHCHVKGDAIAEKKIRGLVKKIGMTPRTFKKLDTIGYHAAAGLVANGAAALGAIGAELLVVSGVPRKEAAKMLGPLLRSVAENVEALAFPEALTGPVRRGDAGAIDRQIGLLRDRLPEAVPLFLASARAQIPLARAIGDAPWQSFDEMEMVLRRAERAREGGRARPRSDRPGR